jgi:hypothetical protein
MKKYILLILIALLTACKDDNVLCITLPIG